MTSPQEKSLRIPARARIRSAPTETSAPLPPVAKLIVGFYVALGVLCVSLILGMTALQRGWIEVSAW